MVYRKRISPGDGDAEGGEIQWVDAKFYSVGGGPTKHKDGEESPEKEDDEDDPVEVQVVERDVTGEVAHVAAQQRLLSVVEDQDEVVFALDPQMRFTSLTFSCFAQWGYTPAELVGRGCWEMLLPGHREFAAGHAAQLLGQNRLAPNPPLPPLLVQREGKNGRHHWEEVRLTASLLPGHPPALNGVARKVHPLFLASFLGL